MQVVLVKQALEKQTIPPPGRLRQRNPAWQFLNPGLSSEAKIQIDSPALVAQILQVPRPASCSPTKKRVVRATVIAKIIIFLNMTKSPVFIILGAALRRATRSEKT
jgi:hypothetical protein